MLKKMGRWSKKLWYSLLRYYRSKIVIENIPQNQALLPPERQNSTPSESQTCDMKDKDLEFLFNQLLEGVVNGWQQNRIEQFFHKLEHRISVDDWLKWLERFEQKIMASSAPNYQMAARMIILGEVTNSLISINRIGNAAYSLGEKLLNKSSNDSLMESLRSHLISNLPKKPEESVSSAVAKDTSSVMDLLHNLQQDSSLAEQTARSLGLQTNEPSLIIEKLLEQTDNSAPELETEASFSQVSTESPIELQAELLIESPTELQSESVFENQEITEEVFEPEMPYPSNWLENWFNTGLERVQAGDLEGAIAAWDKLLEYDNKIAQAWHNRGSALAYLNRLEEAVSSFDKAISINVNDYQSWNDRGNVLYNLKRWEEALISWDRTVGIEPSYSQAWYNRGLVLEKLNLMEEALESYDEALNINPTFELAKNRKNQLLANLKQK